MEIVNFIICSIFYQAKIVTCAILYKKKQLRNLYIATFSCFSDKTNSPHKSAINCKSPIITLNKK